MTAITVIKTQDKFFLLTTEDNLISAFNNVAEGVQHYQALFNQKHYHSYESSMSTTIFWLQVQPSVLESPPMKEIKDALVNGRASRVLVTGGAFNGAELKSEIGNKWFDAGIQPKLIS